MTAADDQAIADAIANGDVAYARLLIADNNTDQIFSDQELGLFVTRGGSVLYGAADALDAIATSEVLLLKKITSQDLTTDGPATAAALHKQAADLRARSDSQAAFSTFGFRPPRHIEGTEYPWLFEAWRL